MSYKQDLRDAELAVIRAADAYDRGVANRGSGYALVEWHTLRGSLDTLRDLRVQLDAPVTPSSDGNTSADAARLALPMVEGLRRRVVYQISRCMRYPIPGATDDQLERAMNCSHQSLSSARRFLVQTGWLVDSGQRMKTRTGRNAKVWILTDFGRDNVVNLAQTIDHARQEAT